MRFTRDFLLLLGLFVMVAGIGASSLWWQRLSALSDDSSYITLIPGSAPEVAEPKTLDRAAIIASLRALLPERQSASVAGTKLEQETIPEDITATSTSPIAREVVWCDATILEAAFSAAWPSSVEVVVAEGARLVRVPGSASGVVTASATLPQAVMQLPLYPATTGEHCLTHSYVGVTPSGRLIHNNDVLLYAGATSGELIGYAFDGHPIMGGENNLEADNCGGATKDGVYAYRLRPNEPFILSCFVGIPATLSILP